MAHGWMRWLRRPDRATAPQGLLGRLRTDVRGNALAIGAFAIIPLIGMVGGGFDLSRMYLTKTRMQHACDAGALAGRKAMGAGVWSQDSYRPRDVATTAYRANFPNGAYGASSTTHAFAENAGVVTGTARSVLPMTLMRVLGIEQETLDVTCRAEMRLPNTDVMFVLDTTGSMNQPQPGDTVNKITALKTAVKCFYEIVARLDTNATCTTGAPTGGTGNEVQIRFGFVPYATNVNVGRLLKTQWMANEREYQTRVPRWWVQKAGVTVDTVNNFTVIGASQADCTTGKQTNATVVITLNGKLRTVTGVVATSAEWKIGPLGVGRCVITKTTTVAVYDWREGGFGRPQDDFIEWVYRKDPITVSGLKNGTSWNASFAWPIGPNGASRTLNWDGCIEERQTVRETSYDPIPSGAYDLNIDMPANEDAKRWGPVLNDAIFTRQGPGPWTLNNVVTTADYNNEAYYACPVESKKLQAWPVAGDFSAYVDSLTPEGNTYHDIGLLWGARLMSATGLFANENKTTPKGGEIERNLIFMTDGDACTDPNNYTAYGVNWFDRRQTDASTAPTGGCTSTGTMTEQVNARTEALCTAIKNKNITLWVVAFGDLATSTETRLETCATPGRYFKATSAAALQSTFKTIADQISMLRLTQ